MTLEDSTPQFIRDRGTPWGKPDEVSKVADGIYWISTPSHGGFYVDEARYEAMPEQLKKCSLTKNRFFEEDCAWCAVALAFPDAMDGGFRAPELAASTYNFWYRAKLGPLPLEQPTDAQRAAPTKKPAGMGPGQ